MSKPGMGLRFMSLRQPYPPAFFTYYKPYNVIHVRKYITGTIGLYHINIQLESTKYIQ